MGKTGGCEGALAQAITDALEGLETGGVLGVAISGGSDSTALLYLLADWARPRGVTLHAVTVDHGLRPEAADEARAVGVLCAGLGIAHETLRWQGWNGRGNTQDQARRARYALMADWARAHRAQPVHSGPARHRHDDIARHRHDDNARHRHDDIARHRRDAVLWLRPLLSLRRADLRADLRARGIGWIEDPGNADRRYQRVRMRAALALLDEAGIGAPALAGAAARLREARAALEIQTLEAARKIARIEAGDVVLARAPWAAHPNEIRARLITHALCWVASNAYRPRRAALDRVLRLIETRGTARGTTTLHGCHVSIRKDTIRITREWQAVRDLRAPAQAIWDRRWRIFGPHSKGLELRALGEAGLLACPGWRESGLPRVSLLASPALWRDDRLVAAPIAASNAAPQPGQGGDWRAELLPGADDFFTSILSH